MKHGSSHNTPNNRQRPTRQQQKPKTENQDQQKGAKWNEGRVFSVQQVLCVNIELSANAGGEVRGDLEDGILLA
jgi:hypothetical protein